MKIIKNANYEEMSKQGAKLMIDLITNKKDAIICLATGGSPKRMYELFVNEVNDQKIDISEVTFVKLDEWYGVAPNDSCTCTTFIKENLLDKLYMQPKQFIEFESNTNDVSGQLNKVDSFIKKHPIDLMILGLGMNGHLGLNEPDEHLSFKCHQAKLNEKTKTHDMAKDHVLESGLTIGLEGIFTSKTVLMLVSGTRKEDAYQEFMSQRISTSTPASLLWLHPNCITMIDSEQFA